MIPIQELTEKRLKERVATLPLKLQQAIDSPANPQIMAQICVNHHLVDEEKILIVEQLTTLVLMGFIHDYDLAREMNEALGLNNPQLASSIASEIGTKIFTPIKTELLANFRPLPVVLASSGKSTVPTVNRAPQPVPLTSSRIPQIPSSAPQHSAPIHLTSDIQKPILPVSSPFSVAKPASQPAPLARPVSPAPMPQSLAKPQPVTLAPLSMSKTSVPIVSALPPKPMPSTPPIAKPPAAPAPAPMMLHRESTATPVQGISFSPSLPADQKIHDTKFDKPALPKPARIDLGGVPTPHPTSPTQPAHPARLVHYSDFKSPTMTQKEISRTALSSTHTPATPNVTPSPIPTQTPIAQKPSTPPTTAAFRDMPTPAHSRIETPVPKESAPKASLPDRHGLPVPPPPPPPPKPNPSSPLTSQIHTTPTTAPQEMIDTESLTKITEANNKSMPIPASPPPQGSKL